VVGSGGQRGAAGGARTNRSFDVGLDLVDARVALSDRCLLDSKRTMV
jgi:hypothetical protein